MEKEEKKEIIKAETKPKEINRKSVFEEAIANIVKGIDDVDTDLKTFFGSYQEVKETEKFSDEAEQLFSRFALSTKSSQPAGSPDRSGKIIYQPVQRSPPIYNKEFPPRGITSARNKKLVSKSVIQPAEAVATKYYKPREDYLKRGFIQSSKTSRDNKVPSPTTKIVRNYRFNGPSKSSCSNNKTSSPGMIQSQVHRNPF